MPYFSFNTFSHTPTHTRAVFSRKSNTSSFLPSLQILWVQHFLPFKFLKWHFKKKIRTSSEGEILGVEIPQKDLICFIMLPATFPWPQSSPQGRQDLCQVAPVVAGASVHPAGSLSFPPQGSRTWPKLVEFWTQAQGIARHSDLRWYFL